jgi:hypothetical protein
MIAVVLLLAAIGLAVFAYLLGHPIWKVLTAVGTFGAVVWAIFQQGILAWLRRPKLVFRFYESEPPHLRQVPLWNTKTGKRIATGYALSIQLINRGKTLAKHAQHLVTGKAVLEDGKWQVQKNWIAVPIRWALDVPAEMGTGDPTEERNLIPNRPYPFNLGLLRTDDPIHFYLNPVTMPGNQDTVYGPGEFCFELTVFAEGAKPAKKVFHIKWLGGCIEDFEEVKKRITIYMKVRPPWPTGIRGILTTCF